MTVDFLLFLLISVKEFSHTANCVAKLVGSGEHYYTEMIGGLPVKAASRHYQNISRVEQIARKNLIISYIELLYIKLGEDIERCGIFHNAHSIDLRDLRYCRLALLVKSSSG